MSFKSRILVSLAKTSFNLRFLIAVRLTGLLTQAYEEVASLASFALICFLLALHASLFWAMF